jgi:hypothetical protein
MHDDALTWQIRDLHARGYSPKEIARALGIRPAEVAPLVRGIAAEASIQPAEPGVVGCWVSPAWSEGLGIDGHRDWPGRNTRKPMRSGLVGVLVARDHQRHGRVSVCGYLVDAWCLGVKDALGPRTMNEGRMADFVERFFAAFDGPPLAAPIELARQLVFGAVEYARGLGFEPHRDFAPAAGHLGPPPETCAIRFGCKGKPHFIQGPHDDARRIMQTLDESVGIENFHFTVRAESFDFEVSA